MTGVATVIGDLPEMVVVFIVVLALAMALGGLAGYAIAIVVHWITK